MPEAGADGTRLALRDPSETMSRRGMPQPGGSLDDAKDRIVVHDHEAAVSAAIELFTRDKAVANLAGNSPHRAA